MSIHLCKDVYRRQNAKQRKSKQNLFFSKDVICYFPPSRYDSPVWLGAGYNKLLDDEHVVLSEQYTGEIPNAITASDVSNLQWLLDVIVDSRAEVERDSTPGATASHRFCRGFDQNNLILFSAARKNLETVLSEILGEPVRFELGHRGEKGGRLRIVTPDGARTVSPSLNSLSTGQMALFNVFSTIIRYADNNDVNKSINLGTISGIVVIDEVDLHLHGKLQYEVLPKLIKLFPKMQFVITSHAPLLILGMEKEFGSDGYEIYQLPEGKRIGAEMFSEFKQAYEYMAQSQAHQSEITKAIDGMQGRALIVTEGSTDWKHMKAAFTALSESGNHQELFDNLDFDFLEYEPGNDATENPPKLEMGDANLLAMCEEHAKTSRQHKLIFIADNDSKNTQKLGAAETEQYKSWGNNVYSFILQVPASRHETPAICIEHLYSDDEIKTEIEKDGVKRRLYMGNEFDSQGRGEGIICTGRNGYGDKKINIIDGSEKCRVLRNGKGDDVNLALPKSDFAKLVLAKQSPFDAFCFDNFIPIFETIKEIIST